MADHIVSWEDCPGLAVLTAAFDGCGYFRVRAWRPLRSMCCRVWCMTGFGPVWDQGTEFAWATVFKLLREAEEELGQPITVDLSAADWLQPPEYVI